MGGEALTTQANFPVLLESFFTQRLINQRQASPHTMASYRDTFRLLLQFAPQQLHREPSHLRLEDLEAPLIGAFLNYLEKGRSNGSRTRHLRLTAMRSFFRYAAYQQPTHSAQIQRLLTIPNKRQARPLVGFLTRPEIGALLAAPDQHTWGGRRDHAFLLMALQTGLRLSEMTALRREDLALGPGAHVRCQGKGRKERCTPLGKRTTTVLKAWLREPVRGTTSDIVFPNARGGRFSADGVQYLVTKHLVAARPRCPSLRQKRVSPHVLRHSAAMELLQGGVDRSVIALGWGHESVETTQIYLDANLALKEEALKKTTPLHGKAGRFRADDRLLQFLKSL
ncbi:MAG TPA: site-specific integrase [Terriglobia bacterium]